MRALHRCAALVALSLLLTSCTSIPEDVPATVQDAPSTVLRSDIPSGDESGSTYYLDDGPPPPGQIALADIPDAVVKWERILPATSRPYVVLGKRYVPFTELQPYRRRGVASWYGKRYHGRKTASGERYDMFQMSAAHPILPIPSYVRVTRVATGESVIVRINDRGPFLQGREIDLSYVAAAKLGIVQAGTGEVVVEAIIPAGTVPKGDAGGRVEHAEAVSDAVYIQLAAYHTAAQAHTFMDTLLQELPVQYRAHLSVHQKGEALYAVQVGPYADHDTAAAADRHLCGQHNWCGFLTKRYQD